MPPLSSPVAIDRTSTGLPLQAGAGFKPQHLDDWLADANAPAFFEVHAENYMGEGGAPHAWLAQMCALRPLSLHGVGLSIGAESPPDSAHLDRLARLIARYQPASFSEHLAWSTHDGRFFSDLLPLTYDARTLDRVCAHIDQLQSRLRMRMLLENPATYLEFAASDIEEPDFIARIVARTGCGLLLDVNNVFVSSHNQGRSAFDYLSALPLRAVEEIHLAGHACDIGDDELLLIDNHGAPVADGVWQLYADVLARIGPVATLIEWDNDVPAYARLRGEVLHADRLLDAARAMFTCQVAA
jgi:uncharacterized protein (UPF0276 family)